jgi:hypothetical protein
MQFLSVLLTAIALIPSGAHLFELPNKIGMSQEAYFTVQSIYRGWALFGFVLIPAILVNAVVAIMVRRQRQPFWLAVAAFLCVALSLIVFFAWTEPANQATRYWMAAPPNWDELRRQWEYSHAATALLMFAGLCSAMMSALVTRDRAG